MYHEFKYGHPEVAEVELTYTRKNANAPELHNSKAIAEVLRKWWHTGQLDMREVVVALYVDRAGRLLCIHEIGRGGHTAATVDPKMVIQAALRVHACGIILAHNHPSGTLHPSAADERITLWISTVSSLLGITCLDHLIINSAGNYYSFADDRNLYLQPSKIT